MAAQDLGQWEDDFALDTVAIHASLLPDGTVLYWGRRSDPNGSLNQPSTRAFILSVPQDDNTPTSTATPTQPKALDGREDVNLFCSGHCLQPDGNLLVFGGHITDGVGAKQACIYNWRDQTWTPNPVMNSGRWYPSALTLPDGDAFCVSGSFLSNVQGRDQISINNQPQIWPFFSATATADPEIIAGSTNWEPVTASPTPHPLYPRLHLDPQGRVFIAGPQAESQFLTIGQGTAPDLWTPGPRRAGGGREYAPSVMYERGKVLFIGGGNDSDQNGPPTNLAEVIDLNAANPQWRTTSSMRFARRQHNATILADGTVLVNGGTQGGGFNNLNIGSPIWAAELWDPTTERWDVLAEEKNDRCYHSIALLLPDGRVLSAGGGEYAPDPPPSTTPNPPKDTLRNARLFRPPYLFKTGRRPIILSAPSEVEYGDDFDVTIDSDDTIDGASWIRLGSVTHSNNMNQSFQRLIKSDQQGSKVTLKSPATANQAPPGHYMLFLLRSQSPPSVAKIIRIDAAMPSTGPAAPPILRSRIATPHDEISLPRLTENMIAKRDRPPVAVGLTPVCPYGLGPCWGGAFEALRNIADVDIVSPVPDQTNFVAFVYTKTDDLPDIDKWRTEFQSIANGAYTVRGIEVSLSCTLEKKGPDNADEVLVATTPTGQAVRLLPATNQSNIKWDGERKAPKLLTELERDAFDRLAADLVEHNADISAEVTGWLKKDGANAFSLNVRKFTKIQGEASILKP